MRRTLVSAAILATALALTGCTAPGSSDGSMTSPPVSDGSAGSEGITTEGGAADSAVREANSALDRQIVISGYLTVTVDEPLEAAAEAARIAESVGGRVDGRTEYAPTDGDKGSATLTLRLPAKNLTATLEKLRALGEVEELSLSSTDVTTESQDLDARIKALSASVDRLVALLSKATDTKTLIELETAISDRQAQLESLESQRRYLDDQVELSTIILNLGSVADAPVDTPDTFWSGLAAGWASMVAFFSGLVVALGVLLPWIVLLGVIAVAVIWIVRRRTRRTTPPTETTTESSPD